MFDRIHPAGRIAAISVAAAGLAACGGAADDHAYEKPSALAVPAPDSLWKATHYTVFRHDDAQPFGLYDAGAMRPATSTDARLTLGSGDGTDLSVSDATSFSTSGSNAPFRVLSRFRGAVLMLCDPASAAGASIGRYVAVAQAASASAIAAAPLFDAAALAGKTFYEVTDCAYRSGAEPQGQDRMHDARTNTLAVAANGDVSVSRKQAARSWTIAADDFTSTLHGVWSNAHHYSAFRFTADGVSSDVLVERTSADATDPKAGIVTLWLPN
jgi:hypothetical protein